MSTPESRAKALRSWRCRMAKCPVFENPTEYRPRRPFGEIDRLCENRMIQGEPRYGVVGDPTNPPWDNTGSAIGRLEQYRLTGNGEHLIDAINLCRIEFAEKKHPEWHFKAAHDSGHTKVKGKGNL